VQSFLVLLIGAPIAAVLGADALFNYFLAARQFIWVLPAIAILAAMAVERYPRAGVTLSALFGIICFWQCLRYFTAPRENWESAASAIAEQVERGACLVVAPPEHARFYEFFSPELSRADCRSPTMVLAITPYTTRAQQETAVAALIKDRYRLERETVVGRSVVVFFRSLTGAFSRGFSSH
jgi:hypothetical protein